MDSELLDSEPLDSELLDGELRHRMLMLELDIVALELDLHLELVRTLPLPAITSPIMARTNLWLYQALPSILPDIPITISLQSTDAAYIESMNTYT